jgi:polyphosphate kinase
LIHAQSNLALEGKPARIFAKLNSLVDRRTIEALYQASQAGVRIDLVIRGICCLRPGLKGISENIQVRSIVDRFLEHSRILVFGEGPATEVYISSADWMPRNFNRRVEVMFPIEDPRLSRRVREEIIPAYLLDNTRARILMPDGTYVATTVKQGEEPRRAQRDLLALASGAPISLHSSASNNGQVDLEQAPKQKAKKTGKRNKPSKQR